MIEELKNEFSEVETRLHKLANLLKDEDKMKDVDELNKDLLITQAKIMESYLGVLCIRIGLNDSKESNIHGQEQ